MVRRKNILGILMQCFVMLCLVSLQWVLFGYSLAFGPETGSSAGSAWVGLNGVGGRRTRTTPRRSRTRRS